METVDTLLIDRRFCGPPDTGNGGYVCGRLAAYLDGPVLVRLQVPTPLGVELAVRRAEAGVELMRGATTVAWARRAEVALQVPCPPGFREAEAAAQRYPGLETHPFPGCFVCGTKREPGDGLRIFAGPTGRDGLVAAPWIPDTGLAGEDGNVRPEFLWAVLDCPGAFSFEPAAGNACVLGEMAASLTGTVRPGERCVVVGWELTRDGRRHHTGTALFAEDGTRLGVARATWFEVPAPSDGAAP